MHKDTLYLLPPGFLPPQGSHGDSNREYCPECAEVWGLMAYFPSVRESLDIVYQDIQKPRKELVALLGEENQNCPTLVLHDSNPVYTQCGIQVNQGKTFINNARDIGKYYAIKYGTPYPRGA